MDGLFWFVSPKITWSRDKTRAAWKCCRMDFEGMHCAAMAHPAAVMHGSHGSDIGQGLANYLR